jgi:heme/copper-type cytochrome/quinol oxidase subunit 3
LFHTLRVEAGLRCGMILFIVSEVMFFFSFFFAFFYLSVNPNMDIGFVWPPADVVVIDPKALPLLNTLLLLSSGT